MSKKYMGAEGKFGTILKVFGSEIAEQLDEFSSSRYLDDPYAEEIDPHDTKTNEDFLQSIPTMGAFQTGDDGVSRSIQEPGDVAPEWWTPKKAHIQQSVYEYGYLFDGLSRGMHLEIKYTNADRRLVVSYQGYPVYEERSGILTCFSPDKAWESLINKLYEKAAPVAKVNKDNAKDAEAASEEYQKTSYIEKMVKRWGLK